MPKQSTASGWRIIKTSMSDEERAWIRVGGIAGVATVIAYFIAVFSPLPWPIRRPVFFSIGPLGIVFVLGLNRLLILYQRTIAVQIATVFGVIGSGVMNLMAVVQAAIGAQMDRHLPTATDAAGREIVGWVRNSVNSVHLGMDVSFDIFFLVSFVLFGWSMLRHPKFGAQFAIPGLATAIGTLILNLYSFPIPPEPDLGPLVGLWLFAVALRMLFCVKQRAMVQANM
jgi:hypothetical protein